MSKQTRQKDAKTQISKIFMKLAQKLIINNLNQPKSITDFYQFGFDCV